MRALARGGYASRRVFFHDQHDAVAAGFRPCFVCMRYEYHAWKARRPVVPIRELRRAYAALGPIEELAGERTYLGRCNTWRRFLINGAQCANDLRYAYRSGQGESERSFNSGLADLLLRAWPHEVRFER